MAFFYFSRFLGIVALQRPCTNIIFLFLLLKRTYILVKGISSMKLIHRMFLSIAISNSCLSVNVPPIFISFYYIIFCFCTQMCFISFNLQLFQCFDKQITLTSKCPPKYLNSQCSSLLDLTVHSMFQIDKFLIFSSKAYTTIYNNSPAWKTELAGRFSNLQIH